MKLFLKSIAFCASFALLFTACTEDETTDAGAGANPEVESSVIESAVAGNGKIQLKWDVPRDENITTCRILWSAGVFSGEQDVTIADLSEGEKAQFSDDYITITDTLYLSAGTYTLSILNVGSVDLDTEEAKYDGTVTVYDSSTYTTQASEANVEYTDNNELIITWAEVPEHLTAMTVTYAQSSSDASSSYATTERFVPVVDGSTQIDNVKRDSYYTLTSYFRPEGALDGEDEYVVLVDDDTSRVVPENDLAASAPKSVTLEPGDSRFKLTWSVPEGTESSIIEFWWPDNQTETANRTFYIRETDGLLLVGEDKTNIVYIGNDVIINGYKDLSNIGDLGAGDYTVKIRNTYNTDVYSEEISRTTSVYDSSTYAAAMPVVVSAEYKDNVVVTWESGYDNSDFIELELTYNGSPVSTITGSDSISDSVDFDFESGQTTFTYTSYFQPAGGFDKVSVSEVRVRTGSEGSYSYTNDTTATLTEATAVDISLTSNTCSIYTAKGLKAFADLVNGNENTCGAMTSGLTGKFGSTNMSMNGTLESDIYLSTVVGESVGTDGSAVSWEPISDYTGTFNGNGRVVYDLYIRSAKIEQGFFGATSGATINNLILENPMIEVWDNKGYVGGIVGDAISTTITGCQLRSSTTSTSTGWIKMVVPYVGESTGNYLGGLVGMATSTTITSSYNYGVPVTNQSGGSYVGGLVGYMGTSSNLSLCVNTGDVTVALNSNITCKSAGGLVGHIVSSNVYNSINAGNVTTENIYAGGVVGYSSNGNVYGCSNYGDVTSTLGSVGGVVGAQYTTGPKVYYCMNEGNIAGGGVAVGGIAGWSGEVGEVNGTGEASTLSLTAYSGTGIFVNATVGTVAPGGSYNKGSVSGTTNVGGIAGVTETTTDNSVAGTCGIWNYENRSSDITGSSTTRVSTICPGNTSGARSVSAGEQGNTYTGE